MRYYFCLRVHNTSKTFFAAGFLLTVNAGFAAPVAIEKLKQCHIYNYSTSVTPSINHMLEGREKILIHAHFQV